MATLRNTCTLHVFHRNIVLNFSITSIQHLLVSATPSRACIATRVQCSELKSATKEIKPSNDGYQEQSVTDDSNDGIETEGARNGIKKYVTTKFEVGCKMRLYMELL